jgi:cell division protease FtsH
MTRDSNQKPPRRPGLFRGPLSPLWFGAVLFGLLLLAQALSTTLNQAETLDYSAFKSLLAQGRIAEVHLSTDTIRGKYQDANGAQKDFTSVRVEDPTLAEQLDAQKVRYAGEVRSEWLGELLGWVFPILLIVGLWMFFFRRMGSAEGGIMSFARSRAKIYSEDDVKVSFADVAGVEEATEELKEIVEFLKTPAKYTTLGGRIPKGVMLVGPPGTGKTLLARAVAGEAKVPFFSLSGSEFVEMFVGVGAARVRDLFKQADAKAPCIVFIDELDALGKARQQSPMGGHEEREQTLNQLLSEMDGFDAKKGVIVMAATNRPEVLDSALLRPGRFDRRVLVDRPDVKGREAILKIHVKQVKLAESVDLSLIAARTGGFAGADLANLVNEAALLAARRDKKAVDRSDFEEAIDRVVAGLEKKRAMNPRIRRVIAVHEMGHAIVATDLPGLDPVHKVSIVGRGFGALGYTMQLPTEDRYLRTKGELQNELAVLLGGRTAELIVFGEMTTGAQNDLMRATDVARAMVTEYGMSESVGPVNHEGRGRPTFLDVEMGPERGVYAEETARQIDTEVKRLITDAEASARLVLMARRDLLDRLTDLLLDKEVLEGDEVRQLMGIPAPDAPGDDTAAVTAPIEPPHDATS